MRYEITKEAINQLKDEFFSRDDYGYASVGELFDRNTLLEISNEIDDYIDSIPAEKNIYASHRKYKQSSIDNMPNETKALIEYLNSDDFIEVLQEMSGIDELYPDPELRGGGIHAIGRGGYLKLHTDFNWHSGLKMHRRLNLLIYLNEVWNSEWKGSIELWDESVKSKLLSLEPQLGNALLFETNDKSYHGHPDPLESPEGVFRKSIALYYYSPDRPESDIKYGQSEMTNYVERPGERFNTDRFRRVRHKIQFLLKKIQHKLQIPDRK